MTRPYLDPDVLERPTRIYYRATRPIKRLGLKGGEVLQLILWRQYVRLAVVAPRFRVLPPKSHFSRFKSLQPLAPMSPEFRRALTGEKS